MWTKIKETEVSLIKLIGYVTLLLLGTNTEDELNPDCPVLEDRNLVCFLPDVGTGNR
jgi:hypothetical protein